MRLDQEFLEKFSDEIEAMGGSGVPVILHFELDLAGAWVLLEGFQLLARIPDLTEQQRDVYTQLGQEIQQSITPTDFLKEAAQRGWEPEFDVDPGEDEF